jgi:hypothetical protein
VSRTPASSTIRRRLAICERLSRATGPCAAALPGPLYCCIGLSRFLLYVTDGRVLAAVHHAGWAYPFVIWRIRMTPGVALRRAGFTRPFRLAVWRQWGCQRSGCYPCACRRWLRGLRTRVTRSPLLSFGKSRRHPLPCFVESGMHEGMLWATRPGFFPESMKGLRDQVSFFPESMKGLRDQVSFFLRRWRLGLRDQVSFWR